LTESPSDGELNILPNGQFLYVPDEGFSGQDSFKYVLQNSLGSSPEYTFVLHVVNENPNARDDDWTLD
ncbi:unnamed protein product, partial [Hapterophycus canaliculatus]